MNEDKSYLSLKGDTNYWLKHLQLLNVGRVARLLSKKDKEIERLNNIIDKAIEYIKNNNLWTSKETSGYSYMKNECNELLEILEESDK